MTAIAGNQRPTIPLNGPLDDAITIDLVDRIRSLNRDYFYNEVQLRISSPGGKITALQYWVESVRQLQESGLRIATHGVAWVASAAAVMLSLGDERTAHRHATLLYHTGRLPGVDGELTARDAASIATALSGVDEEVVELLAERAGRAPAPAADTPEDRFGPGDWAVIGLLGPGNARRRATALRRFRRRVAEAFAGPSTRLGALYREFCSLDKPISPHLARELGLIDGVGGGGGEPERASDDGGLTVPEWDPLYPAGRVPRAALTRHTLILGESGSGKTVSGVVPVLSAMLREGSPVSCALVIDPKGDLLPAMRRVPGANRVIRQIVAGVDSIDVMSGPRSVEAEVRDGQYLSAARKILARASTFADSPARQFAGKGAGSLRHAFWENEGARMAQCALAFTLLLTRGGWLEGLLSRRPSIGWRLRDRLWDFGTYAGPAGDGGQTAPPLNILAVAHRALGDFFVERTPRSSTSEARRLTARDAVDAIVKAGGAGGRPEIRAIGKELRYWDRCSSGTGGQYIGALGEARRCFAAFADPAPARSLFFGVESNAATVDFERDVGAESAADGRAVHVYQPRLDGADALIAKALKGSYFEAVLACRARRERGASMPVTFYVADEFHRFITSDAGHGEQSFLDTCRSFGTACVLATQADASIRHALLLSGEPSPDMAIRILLTNTATKLFFRSTEAGTRDLVDGVCPGSGADRVTVVRPPSSLRPGECYASLPDGRFERRQLRLIESPALERGIDPPAKDRVGSAR